MVETLSYDYPKYEVFDVCVNDFLCCTVLDSTMVIDLVNEVFTTVDKLSVKNSDACITNFTSYIDVISFIPKKFKHNIRLWTLEDDACFRDGEFDVSWTVMLSILVDFSLWKVYSYFGSGGLFLNVEEGIWNLYDSEKNVLREIPIFNTKEYEN